MEFMIQLVARQGSVEPVTTELIRFEREALSMDTFGLALVEAKTLLGRLQLEMIRLQVDEHVGRARICRCGRKRRLKDNRMLPIRTAFGKLDVRDPRLHACSCDAHAAGARVLSPVRTALGQRVTPDLLHLETRWASLVSFGVTRDLLADVLPLGEHFNAATIRNDVMSVAKRLDSELGDEQSVFVDGCQEDWNELPIPDPPLTVGIDGGYVRSAKNRKVNFEVIVGKSVPERGEVRRFGFTTGYDKKPRRRLYEVLRSQGLAMNQQVTFMSDGGDTVRKLQLHMSPNAEHLLDWFHLSMRLTVMTQQTKSLCAEFASLTEQSLGEIERVRHYLWHGNTDRAIDVIEDIQCQLDEVEKPPTELRRLSRSIADFVGYVLANAQMIPNYGDRWRHGEAVSTAFVESAVNQIVSKRFAKKQQMQWSDAGAHLLLQTRTRVLDGTLGRDFKRWYPNAASTFQEVKLTA